MKHHFWFRLILVLVATCSLSALQLEAQTQRCQPPAPPTGAANIFSHQQEMDLGDAIAEHFQRDFRVIDDDEVVAHLRRVGERVAKQLPSSELRFQFFLSEQPVANAFGLPGGRVYVSRKMVAFAHSDDELAGVLAQEVARIATRQGAIHLTRLFREMLGVREVSDRRDIFDKYNQMVGNAARKQKVLNLNEGRDDRAADQIAIYAMTAAGYDPQAFATLWDRSADTRGDTGNWFSDLFGTTRPESRRLREILKSVAALPPDCIAKRVVAPAGEFARWQAAVINYSGLGRREALQAVLSKKQLDPPLRGDINHLRFSPDGKYVLAQDDTGINVLAREPFVLLFRIVAPEARAAQWTPDSQSIVFHNAGLRIESWSVVEEQLKSVHEMVVRKGCPQSALSPDGKTLACIDWDYDLTLFDVASGAEVFQKKSFYEPGDAFPLLLIGAMPDEDDRLDFIRMAFSPDARYFVAGRRDSVIAVDLNTRTTVSLGGPLKKLIAGKFTFIAPDRLAGTEFSSDAKSVVVTFPQGEVIDRGFDFGKSNLAAPTRGNYLLVQPAYSTQVGVLNLATKKIFMAIRQSAIDLYDDVFVSELANGELALHGVEKRDLRATVLLPRNPLGNVRAVALSPDFKWLAVSELSRGAVWNLTTGERIFHVRGFRGAHFGDDGVLYTDFPKFEQTKRTIGRMVLANGGMSEGIAVAEAEAEAAQHGPFVLSTKSLSKNRDAELMASIQIIFDPVMYSELRGRDYVRQNVRLEMRDARTGTSLWSKDFPKEAPRAWVNPNEATMVFSWSVSASRAKAEIKKDPALSARLSAMKEKEGDYFLQTLDARTGQPTGGLLIETGKDSFRIADAFVAGDWVVITDTANRIIVYSLSTGEQKGKIFGSQPAVAKATGLLSVENERGQLTVYGLAAMDKRKQFTFSSPVALTQFSADGRRLFVLTANQTAYVLSLASSVP